MSLWNRGERVPDPAPAVHPNEIEQLRKRVEHQFLNAGDVEGRSSVRLQIDALLRAIGNTIPDTRDLLLDWRNLVDVRRAA
jgi:hypothetical protein